MTTAILSKDWNCRCDVTEVLRSRTMPTDLQQRGPLPQIAEGFKTNVGKSGQVFDESHPYFGGVPKLEQAILRQIVELDLMPEGFSQVYQGKEGSYVQVHEKHGADELKANLEVAKQLADLGERVRLLPRSNEKTPDATRNSEAWEFKRLENYSNPKGAVATAVRKAKDQAGNILLHFPGEYPGAEAIGRGLSQAVYHDKELKIQRVTVLHAGQLHSINRAQIQAYNYASLKK